MSSRGKKKKEQATERETSDVYAEEHHVQRQIQMMNRTLRGGFSGMQEAKRELFQEKNNARQLIVHALEKNGLTLDDLSREYERGREEGFRQASMPIIQCCYAGICIALHDEFGFGTERCYRALKAVDKQILWTLHHSEQAEELLKKTGLVIDFDDPFERIQKAE